jgi:Cu(I)/Ag(I) efflux system membrane fusion protein
MVEILEGLKPGEMVVTSGQFLLDSESNRREFLAKLIRGTPAAEPAAAAPAAVATELKSLPAPAGRELAALLEAYFQIGERLYQDSTDLDAPARALAAAAEALTRTDLPENPHFWHQHAEPGLARAKALELVGLKDLPSCRERFADLSVAVGRLLRATGVPAELARQVLELHCPMYREGQGGNIWLQAAGEVHNPFFGRGSGMARCFDRVASLPGVGGTPATAPATLPAAEPLGQPPAEGAGRR